MVIKVLMVVLLSGGFYALPAQTSGGAAARYVCPMHPNVTSSKPGKCYKCKMALKRTRAKPETPAAAEAKPSNVSKESAPRLPDVTVMDQNGNSLNFYSDLVKGKVVAVNFVFTTCTAICPSLTATFRKVQQQMAAQNVRAQLISISVDPMTDTPERLHDFATKFKAEPGWTFVTGDAANIDAILKEFGFAVANKNDHTPMVVIGNDEAGHWTRAYGLSSPASLVKLIADAGKQE